MRQRHDIKGHEIEIVTDRLSFIPIYSVLKGKFKGLFMTHTTIKVNEMDHLRSRMFPSALPDD